MSKPTTSVRWGLVGVGNVCEYKAGPPIYQLPGSELALVHRRDRAAGLDFIQRHGHGRYAGSLDELLSAPDIDAVYVATPHALHAAHTIRAIEAGKPVMVEKPMATSTDDCDRMVDAARRSGLPLAVAYYRRGYPSIQRIRDLLHAGEIGAPLQAAVNDEFPTSHRLDLVHFLFGDIEAARSLPGNRDSYSMEATVDRFEVRTRSGVTVRMMTGWSESGMPEAIRVTGETGSIYLEDLKGGFLSLTQRGSRQAIHCGSLPFTHWGIFDNFNRHLREGVPLLCDGEEGRKSSVLLDFLELNQDTPDWFSITY